VSSAIVPNARRTIGARRRVARRALLVVVMRGDAIGKATDARGSWKAGEEAVEEASEEASEEPGKEPGEEPGEEPGKEAGTLAPCTMADEPRFASPSAAAAGAQPTPLQRIDPAFVVMLAGVCAALHVGKLPPAIPALQAAFGLSLVQAGFLLSMVQVAGMTAGLAFGALADGLGPRRSMLFGLVVLALASTAGAFAPGDGAAAALMLLRAGEGFGFLLVVLAAPALVRRLVAPERLSLMLGIWGAYMPLATMLALGAGPAVIGWVGWPAWWALLGVASAAMALWLARTVPRAAHEASRAPGALSPAFRALRRQLPRTLRARGPWLLAAAFAVYSGQWLAVIGFLPTIYAAAGFGPGATGALTALVAGANMVGNIAAGRALHAGARPQRLLRIGYTTMALAALLAFAAWPLLATAAAPAGSEPLLPAWLRYLAVLAFSGVGGLVPATLFTLAVPATPREGSLSATAGWMQQWSAAGQFAGPPLAAWVAASVGGWHLTWAVTGACALAGLGLGMAIARFVVRPAGAAGPSSPAPSPSQGASTPP
jgi:MFS family permease